MPIHVVRELSTTLTVSSLDAKTLDDLRDVAGADTSTITLVTRLEVQGFAKDVPALVEAETSQGQVVSYASSNLYLVQTLHEGEGKPYPMYRKKITDGGALWKFHQTQLQQLYDGRMPLLPYE